MVESRSDVNVSFNLITRLHGAPDPGNSRRQGSNTASSWKRGDWQNCDRFGRSGGLLAQLTLP
jgi:hypothetical protein